MRFPRTTPFLLLILCAAAAVAQPVIDADEGVMTIHWKSAGQAIGDVAYVCGKVINVTLNASGSFDR